MAKLETIYRLDYKGTHLSAGRTLLECLGNYIADSHSFPYRIVSLDVGELELKLKVISNTRQTGTATPHKLRISKDGDWYKIPQEQVPELQAMVNLWLS